MPDCVSCYDPLSRIDLGIIVLQRATVFQENNSLHIVKFSKYFREIEILGLAGGNLTKAIRATNHQSPES